MKKRKHLHKYNAKDLKSIKNQMFSWKTYPWFLFKFIEDMLFTIVEFYTLFCNLQEASIPVNENKSTPHYGHILWGFGTP